MKFCSESKFKGPLACKIFIFFILKAGVSVIILIPNIPENNVYFRRYINLKDRKRSPKYSFGDGDFLKFAADSPTMTLAILKVNA